jgi:hypothetical protein
MTEPMRVTKENLIDSLRVALPGFENKSEFAEDVLGYPIFNDLARYVCDQARLGDFDEVRNSLAFLEVSLQGRDAYARDLVLECLETLVPCKDIELIRQHFGSRTVNLWRDFFHKDYEKPWDGGGKPKLSS